MSDIEIEVEEPWMQEVLGRAAERYPVVRIKLLRQTSRPPQYMTAGAAGADVFADIQGWRGMPTAHLANGSTYKIPLGFSIEVPPDMVGILKGRSGLATRGHEVHVAAIDSDYRGEVCMLLHVSDCDGDLRVDHGDRVGQILFIPVARASFELVDKLSDTERGSGGFGSTGAR